MKIINLNNLEQLTKCQKELDNGYNLYCENSKSNVSKCWVGDYSLPDKNLILNIRLRSANK